MWTEKNVFKVLVGITQSLGLQMNSLNDFHQIKRFALFLLFYGVPWLLMVAKFSLQFDQNDLVKFSMLGSTTFNLIKPIYFLTINQKVLKLQSVLIETFADDESKKFNDAAEKRLVGIFKRLVLLLTPAILVSLISFILANELAMPFYNFKSWENSKFVHVSYIVLECSWVCFGYVSLWGLNLIIIHFMIYLQEYSKFVACRFEAMRTQHQLKTCVELHLKFKE